VRGAVIAIANSSAQGLKTTPFREFINQDYCCRFLRSGENELAEKFTCKMTVIEWKPKEKM
jgi:hypothetical protein